MTVVGPDELRFRDFPGRSTSDPFQTAGPGASTVREVMIDYVPSRSPHLHPESEEIVYVVAGTGRVWLDGVFHHVGPGSWYRIPARTPHATLADRGQRMSLVCFFPHDDFAQNIEELDLVINAEREDAID
ncbi:MAG TPA: cupin domain-containing protein [Acidimicrobiia bacterium]|nr:cupin domain-containing protein [Acidimicrobiia bacterium]